MWVPSLITGMPFFTTAWNTVRSCLNVVYDIIRSIWTQTTEDVTDNYDQIKSERDEFKIAYTLRTNSGNIDKRRREVEAQLTSAELARLNNLC